MNKEVLIEFFECYFHQDWREEHKSSIDAVRDFCRNKADKKIQVRNSLQEALNLGAVSDDFIHKMEGNFIPSIEGYSVEDWVKMAIKIIDEDLESKASKPF